MGTRLTYCLYIDCINFIMAQTEEASLEEVSAVASSKCAELIYSLAPEICIMAVNRQDR